MKFLARSTEASKRDLVSHLRLSVKACHLIAHLLVDHPGQVGVGVSLAATSTRNLRW